MANDAVDLFFQHLRIILDPERRSTDTDGQLLARWAGAGDGRAFAALVARHGALVWRASRGVLHLREDIEDVFQATFLMLARKAASLQKRSSITGWLYQTASRLALKARTAKLRRLCYEEQAGLKMAVDPLEEISVREARTILSEELDRLSAVHREVILLCLYEGATQDEAAKRLGCSLNTLKRRLERGRTLLGQRLTKRGLAPESAFALTLCTDINIPVQLIHKTITLASKYAAGEAITGAAALLAEGALRMILVKKLAVGCAVVLSSLTIVVGTLRVPSAEPGANGNKAVAKNGGHGTRIVPVTMAAVQDDRPANDEPEVRLDVNGDPLPDYARQRIGTVRFRPSGLVYACAFSPDGKYLLAGTEGQGIAVFDAVTGRLVRTLGDQGAYASCAFSPKGDFVAASRGGSIYRWVLATGELVRAINTPQEHIWSLAFTPDGSRLLSGGNDKSMRFWDLATDKELANFEGHEAAVCSVAITPDGKYAVSGSRDMTVRLWEIATGKMEREFTGRKPITPVLGYAPVALSCDGKWLATTDGKPGVCVYEVVTGKLDCRMPSGETEYRALAFSHDGKTIAAGTAHHQFQVWDVATRQIKQKREVGPHTTYRGWHWGGIPSVAFSPDDTRVAFAEDSRVVLWDLVKGKDLEPVDLPAGTVYRLRFASDGQSLVTASDDPRVKLSQWDINTGQLRRRLRGDFPWPDSFDLSATLQILATSRNKYLRFWDTTSGQEIRKVTLPLESIFVNLQPLIFSSDDKWLAGGGNLTDHTARVWDAKTGDEVCRLDISAEHWKLAFAPDGKTLASAVEDQVLRIHDAATGKTLREWPNPSLNFLDGGQFCFSPDGNLLATLGANGKTQLGNFHIPSNEKAVHLWEAATGKLLRLLNLGERAGSTTPAFSPNGRMLASAGADGSIQLWEVATGKERRLLSRHNGPVTSLAFSPNGKMLASGSDDTTTLLWDAYAIEKTKSPRMKLAKEDREKFWQKLADTDAAAAFKAICELIARPNEAVGLLDDTWKGMPRATVKQMGQWLEELNSEQFAVRKTATEEMVRFAANHEDMLREALQKPASLEARQRLEKILAQIEPERLRRGRMLEVLEQLRTPEARRFLQALVEQKEDPLMAREAGAGLKRLEGRK